jgi:hypothetical protein
MILLSHSQQTTPFHIKEQSLFLILLATSPWHRSFFGRARLRWMEKIAPMVTSYSAPSSSPHLGIVLFWFVFLLMLAMLFSGSTKLKLDISLWHQCLIACRSLIETRIRRRTVYADMKYSWLISRAYIVPKYHAWTCGATILMNHSSASDSISHAIMVQCNGNSIFPSFHLHILSFRLSDIITHISSSDDDVVAPNIHNVNIASCYSEFNDDFYLVRHLSLIQFEKRDRVKQMSSF